jgi:hypothetical protein
MVSEEMKKYLESLSKEDLLALCIRLLMEQMNSAAKLCNELANMGKLLRR